MGAHKALLPLGNQIVLERVVGSFISAGIHDIRIVTGYDRSTLQPVITGLPVLEIVNPHFHTGMYSSVRAGVASLEPDCTGFFVHPVDIPLISPATIRFLASTPGFDSNHIISPVFKGEHGHPPLLGSSFRELILASSPPSGLAGLLQNWKDAIITVQVQDPGIRMNMNTPDDYRHLLDLVKLAMADKEEENGSLP
jgi:CTP:molybdopterin cytidylyltransferase MocA